MERRDFLRLGAATAGALAFGPDFWRRAYAAPASPGPGPYGSLAGRPADGEPDALAAGGYPVPAMPVGGAVRGAAAPLVFGQPPGQPVPATVAGDSTSGDGVTMEERIDG